MMKTTITILSFFLLLFSTPLMASSEMLDRYHERLPKFAESYELVRATRGALLNSIASNINSLKRRDYLASEKAWSQYYQKVLSPFARKYAWGIPNDEAIQTVLKYGPVVEIGAGKGYWAKLIDEAGGDIVAYDPVQSESAYLDGGESWFPVRNGNQLAIHSHQDRTLLLVWPLKENLSVCPCCPNNTLFAVETLLNYHGDTVIYVGEPQEISLTLSPYSDYSFSSDGATAGPNFFRILELMFELKETITIPNYPGYSDKLFVYQRKKTRIQTLLPTANDKELVSTETKGEEPESPTGSSAQDPTNQPNANSENNLEGSSTSWDTLTRTIGPIVLLTIVCFIGYFQG